MLYSDDQIQGLVLALTDTTLTPEHRVRILKFAFKNEYEAGQQNIQQEFRKLMHLQQYWPP